MKNTSLTIFLYAVLFNFAYCQSSFLVEVRFDESIKIDNEEEFYLRVGGSNEILTKGYVTSNKVALSGIVDKPTVVMLQSKNPKFIKGSKILLENASYKTYIDTIPRKSTIRYQTQSTFHNVWIAFYDGLDSLNREKSDLIALHNHYVQSDPANADSAMARIDELSRKELEAFKALGREHPSNYATAYILTAAPDLGSEYREIYDALSDELKQTEWANSLKEKIYAANDHEPDQPNFEELRKKLENFEIKGMTIHGDPIFVTPSFIAKKNSKWTIIDVWASWCAPCRVANADLYILYNKYKNAGLDIISFSLDANHSAWEQASEKDNISWLNISDRLATKSPVLELFSIIGIPFNVVLDDKGALIGINMHNKDIEELLNKDVKQ